MSGGKPRTPAQNVQAFNKRVPVALEREQQSLAKKLRKDRYRNDPHKALAEIYDYLDRYYAYSDGLVACKKGCSYCCHMPVVVSQVEAEYIAKQTGIKAATIQPKNPEDIVEWVDRDKPCPFLRNDMCSIYAFRPMNCRTHVSFENSNEKCHFDSKSKIAMTDRDSSFPGVMQAFRGLLLKCGPVSGDIRDYFKATF
jgi:hypothetical protein